MAALASDWLRHFRPLHWNRWMEFNEPWQEARSLHQLPSLCFSGRLEKQDGCPDLWFAETYRLLLWNCWIEFNETRQDVNVLYKVGVFRADRKIKMATPVSDFMRHFLHLLWNCWTEFNETWQDARSKCPSLCFSGWSEWQSWLAKKSSLKRKYLLYSGERWWPFGLLFKYLTFRPQNLKVSSFHCPTSVYEVSRLKVSWR